MSILDTFSKTISTGTNLGSAGIGIAGALGGPALANKFASYIGLNTNNLPRAAEGFDINGFRSEIVGDTGLLRNNLFLVSIEFPKAFASTQTNLMKVTPRSMMMFCEQASLPGLSLSSDDGVRRYGTGPTEKMAYGAIFTDLSLGFLADGQGEILKMYHNWMKYIVNYDSRYNGVTGLNFAEPYEVGYKDEYAATIQITVFNESSDKVITYTLNEAFPLFLGEISMGWADNDSIMKIPVTFSYRDWQSDSLSIMSTTKGVNNSLTTLQKLLKIGSVVQVISALKKPQGIGDIINVVNNASMVRGLF
jgi:hypothetical protein